MLTLTSHECRVLGVLVEKAYTTPAQYPLSVNAVMVGANQKSNRDPVLTLSEDDVMDTLDGLRAKGLAREVMLSSSRVQKHRQVAKEALAVTTSELVILTELFLRGPQTAGELRGRASRMHPLASLDEVSGLLTGLMERSEPYVRSLAPAPGSRATRYGQLFRPDLHPLEAAPVASGDPAPAGALAIRVERLEAEIAALWAAVGDVRAK